MRSTGIPKTMPDHHGAPYSLTEDFVTVYRHAPADAGRLLLLSTTRRARRSPRSGFMRHPGRRCRRRHAAVRAAQHALFVRDRPSRARSRCTTSRARCTNFERDGEMIDLSVVDIVRTRRRGVPRYNDFRAGLHRPRVTRWEELAVEPEDRAPAEGDLRRHRHGRHGGRPVRRDRRRRASASATPPSASSS